MILHKSKFTCIQHIVNHYNRIIFKIFKDLSELILFNGFFLSIYNVINSTFILLIELNDLPINELRTFPFSPIPTINMTFSSELLS